MPFVVIMEVGLPLRADAELTGETESALTLLLEGWEEDDGDNNDDDDDDDDTWGEPIVDALG